MPQLFHHILWRVLVLQLVLHNKQHVRVLYLAGVFGINIGTDNRQLIIIEVKVKRTHDGAQVLYLNTVSFREVKDIPDVLQILQDLSWNYSRLLLLGLFQRDRQAI